MGKAYADLTDGASETGVFARPDRVANTLPGQILRIIAAEVMDKRPHPPQVDPMVKRTPRLAARALILHQDRLLLVNAFPDRKSDLWCAPGGGVENGASLPDNLAREIYEECGLRVAVGVPALINEFHDPRSGFHQVDLFFRCTILSGVISDAWRDPEGVVTDRQFFSRDDLERGRIRFKPDSLAAAAWGDTCLYDPLELLVL